MSAEGPCGSIANQPWANNPPSMTETGEAYRPEGETKERYWKAVEDYALRSYRPPEVVEVAP